MIHLGNGSRTGTQPLYEVVRNLSNDDIFNDLEWSLISQSSYLVYFGLPLLSL